MRNSPALLRNWAHTSGASCRSSRRSSLRRARSSSARPGTR
ncbi:UNVERIFIED_CONTAM: hypothetical protein GTU68_009114 [Idotea baltica]|nr:hypothetical protein [Idotea baltica]